MAQVALTQKPLKVAVGSRTNPFAAQRGPLVAVALRVGLVALLAVVAIEHTRRRQWHLAGRPADWYAHDPWQEHAPNAKRRPPPRQLPRRTQWAESQSASFHCAPHWRSETIFQSVRIQRPGPRGRPWSRLVSSEAEAGREAEAHASGQLPANQRGNVVRGIAHGQREGVSQAAVGLHAGDELLRAKGTFPAAGRAAQRARGPDGVAKLPGIVAEVFLGDKIFADIPILHIGGENQLQLRLMLMFAAQMALGGARSAWPSWPTNSRMVLSAPEMFSYST